MAEYWLITYAYMGTPIGTFVQEAIEGNPVDYILSLRKNETRRIVVINTMQITYSQWKDFTNG